MRATKSKEVKAVYARVVSAQVAPDRMDELERVLREVVVPTAEAQRGFQEAMVLLDSATGKGMMITLWATAADLAAGEASGYLVRQLATVAPLLRGAAVRETYEVAVRR
jgi:heme-degrading monooxygenase HmoA